MHLMRLMILMYSTSTFLSFEQKGVQSSRFKSGFLNGRDTRKGSRYPGTWFYAGHRDLWSSMKKGLQGAEVHDMKASLCRARETRKAERGTPIAARHDVANRSGNTGAEDGGETELQEGQRKTKAERTKKKRRRRKKRRPPITSRYRRSLKTQKTENQPHYFYLPPSLRLPLLHAPISRNSP